MKHRTRQLVYPPRTFRISPDPTVDVLTGYTPMPTGGPCAGHPGVASVWQPNQGAPGWHCAVCHKLPEAEMKGETE